MDRQIKKKKWTPAKITLYSLGSLFMVFVLYSVIFGDKSSKLNVKLDRIAISTVSIGPFQEFIPVIGTVIPINTVYLDAVDGGRVEKIFIDEAGGIVKKNDMILKFSNTNLLLNIMFREAQFFQTQNNLMNSRLQLSQSHLRLKQNLMQLDQQIKTLKRQNFRYHQLLEKNYVPKEEYETIHDQYLSALEQKELAVEIFKQDSVFRVLQIKQLEESVKRLEENLGISKKQLEDLTIRAPISGHLTSLNVEIGQLIPSGARIGQIDVLDGFKIRALVDEHYIARILIGQQSEFEFNGTVYRLVTRKIFQEVIEGQFQVDLEFVNEEAKGIRRGQTVQLRLELGDSREALVISRGGFFQNTGGQWVYVVNPDGNYAIKRDIRLGRQNPKNYEVLEGLEPGEKVITSSYELFGDIDKLVLK